MNQSKGTDSFPFSLSEITMTETTLDTIRELLQPLLEEDLFLVDLRVKPTNNIKLFIDADNGLPIERCIRVNRALYKKIEEAGLFPDGDFSLEVSSPGVDEPLKSHRQYLKNTGRLVDVSLKDETRLEGTLTAVSEDHITIESTEGKGKKAVQKTTVLPFTDIRQTKVLIQF
ncbi:MAG: ribosome maturation factor RimP [Ferruginibacter sp.]